MGSLVVVSVRLAIDRSEDRRIGGSGFGRVGARTGVAVG